jgi:O-antigen/teichoic acid export membrane protein
MLRHISIYGAGQLLRGISSLLLLPVYTRFLSPADYGLVELISAIVDLTALVLGLRIGAGIFKHYADAVDEGGRRRVVSTALSLLVLANAIGAVALVLLASSVAAALDAPPGFALALRVTALTLVFSAVNETFFAYLRVRDRSVLYVACNLARFLGQFVLGVLFVAVWELGYWGVVWASVLSSAAVALGFTVSIWPRIGLGIDPALARRLARFSVPIMIAALGMYCIAFGNRYLLQVHVGIGAVGIYALAYKFGLTFYGLFWTPFATYWSARQYDYAERPDARRFFGDTFLSVSLIVLCAATAITVAAPHFLRLVAREDFWQAGDVVPWLIGSSILLCWTDFFRIGLLRASRTGRIALGTLGSAVLVTVLYQRWIPASGVMGAAKATVVAYLFQFVYTFLVGRRLFAVEVPWSWLAVAVAYFVAWAVALVAWALPDLQALFVKPALAVLAGAVLLVIRLRQQRGRAWLQVLLNPDERPAAIRASE